MKLPEAIYAKVGKNWDDRRTGTQFSDAEGKAVAGSLADIYK